MLASACASDEFKNNFGKMTKSIFQKVSVKDD